MALTDAQKESQLREAGWSPSAGDSVAAAWARTATAEDQAAANAPSPSTPAPAPAPGATPAKPQDLSGYIAAMQASSGFSIKQLDEQKREFDAQLEWQKQQWAQQGLPELAIKQRVQDLEEKKFTELQQEAQFSQNLQTRQQDLNEKVQLGQLSIAEAQQQLAREIQTGQLRVSQGQLGLDTLKTAASLSGPENWIQASNFNRGVAANSLLPGYVSNLLTGQSTAVMGGVAPGAQMSAPLTLQGIAGQQGAAPAVVPQYAVQNGAVQPVAAVAPVAGAPAAPAIYTAAAPAAAGAAVTSPMATPDDVARLFGRPTATAQQQQTDAAAAALSQVYQRGGQSLAPQQYEGMTDTERKMFEGGGAAIGADVPGFVEAYKRSRIGQRAATPSMAA